MPDSPVSPSIITAGHLAKALTYTEYRNLIAGLLKEGKTTGPQQHPKLIQFTELNTYRMSRLDKTMLLKESLVQQLEALTQPWIWLVLTEAWCPDSAQNIPVLAKMAEVSPLVELKMLLRDENPDIMDQYLTNGSRSIPKLICLKENTLEEVGTWGPRPATVQRMVLEHKADPQGVSHDEFLASVQLWYTKDKGLTLQQEFEELLPIWIRK